MAPSKLRAAVIGAGEMGRHHARILGGMPDVDLVAIVDHDTALAATRVGMSAAQVLSSIDELPELDFAVVAVPTDSHVATAMTLMDAGVSLLIEKPLAPTAAEAEELARYAAEKGVVLGAGHVERFNAALGLLASLVKDPVMMSFERLSPYTPRVVDDVLIDLMVHDLDLALWILGEYPVDIRAAGSRVFSDTFDVASAVLRFPSGCIATFQCSRTTQDKIRRASVSERERFIVADSIQQHVSIKRETAVEFSEAEGPVSYRQANIVEVPYLDRSGEPLARELRDFADAVREGRPPLVTGEDGAQAVRLAREIEAAARG